jgi:hypothetical protein
MTQLRYEMANLKDKLNVVEQLLPTITGKYGLPHHLPGFVFMNVIFLNFNDNYGVSLINIEDKGHSFQTILKIRIPFKTIIYNVK